MSGVTQVVEVVDLDTSDAHAVATAAALLSQSVHESIRGLVPYNAPGYRQYLEAALAPPAQLRTMIVRAAREEGKLIGVADWRMLADELFLNGLCVTEAERGSGLGRALLEDGLALASRYGLQTLGLDVVAGNDLALSLYRRMGFVATQETWWHDLPNASTLEAEADLRLLDWSAFRAHMSAYGFGDLNVRGGDVGPTRIRQIGRTMRVDFDATSSSTAALKSLLDVERVFTTTITHQLGPAAFSRSTRMSRQVRI